MFLLFSFITTFLLVCFTDVVSLLRRLVQLFGKHLEHTLNGGEGFLGLPQRCPEAVQHTVLCRLPGGPEPQHGLIVVHLSQNIDQCSSNVYHCSACTFCTLYYNSVEIHILLYSPWREERNMIRPNKFNLKILMLEIFKYSGRSCIFNHSTILEKGTNSIWFCFVFN